ncbi:MAG TPA: TIM barrel protein [Rhizomicrobium sp.]|nr:TIM barrel protein [Rhizomicrobium sp.]
MERRELLKLGAAALAAGAITRPALADTPGVPAGWKNHLDAYSRTLHWLRTPAEVANACHQIGNTTIDLTVRAYPGHVQPEKVKTDLPLFVNGLKREGITVTKIAMDIVDASTPYTEDMLDAASALGIRFTWWRGVPFDWTKPYPQMIDALKPRVGALSKLLEKYGVKACWHPFGGFTEIFDVCRNFDPRYIAIDYDTGNFGQFEQNMLADQLRIAGPYVGSVVFKDHVMIKQTPEEQAAAAAAAAARGGRGGRGPSPTGWTSPAVPIGTGVVDVALVCKTLKDINFQGPIECQPEWPALDGAGQGQDKLSITRDDVIGMLRRDYQTVSGPLAAAGVI